MDWTMISKKNALQSALSLHLDGSAALFKISSAEVIGIIPLSSYINNGANPLPGTTGSLSLCLMNPYVSDMKSEVITV